jgi:hypothetical protein
MQRHGWQGPVDGSWNPTAVLTADSTSRRALCPRCGSDRAVDYGAQVGCGRCGACWQADANLVVELPPSRAHRPVTSEPTARTTAPPPLSTARPASPGPAGSRRTDDPPDPA